MCAACTVYEIIMSSQPCRSQEEARHIIFLYIFPSGEITALRFHIDTRDASASRNSMMCVPQSLRRFIFFTLRLQPSFPVHARCRKLKRQTRTVQGEVGAN